MQDCQDRRQQEANIDSDENVKSCCGNELYLTILESNQTPRNAINSLNSLNSLNEHHAQTLIAIYVDTENILTSDDIHRVCEFI